ncbi:MAG: hypothetical protein Q9Q40_11860 [Acidobacteriota bacterium]|nr:hypothetical protein [Acidobacteriota bacterium]MDQ7087144.1 hypothetical protein [Acidobacteriota bacterium]
MFSLFGAGFSFAQQQVGYGCFSEPVDMDEALLLEHPGPIYAILCPDPIDPPCTEPAAPQVSPVLKRGTSETSHPCPVAA